jgi:hypothetical protein
MTQGQLSMLTGGAGYWPSLCFTSQGARAAFAGQPMARERPQPLLPAADNGLAPSSWAIISARVLSFRWSDGHRRPASP